MPATSMLPASGRPRLAETAFRALVDPLGLDLGQFPLIVCGMRGFFAAAMGPTAGNDRNVYDDALFLWAPALGLYRAFNGNTDPSHLVPGLGATQGTAVLDPGVWYAYRFDEHRGTKSRYEAICQRAADVTVTRDGNPPTTHKGRFGINIHRGGNFTTSSEGCQTVPPTQWQEFIDTAHDAGRRLFGAAFRQRVIPYVLLDAATVRTAVADPPRTPRETAERFRTVVIAPTLERMALGSRAGENLLLGTALVESRLQHRVQTGGGSALGLFQMEPRTHDDIWQNYLAARPALARSVIASSGKAQRPEAAELQHNDAYACAMARVHYLRVPDRLPGEVDLAGMARYWKRHYDTLQGARSAQDFLDAWAEFLGAPA